MSRVFVVDYGIGNVFSVCHALRRADAEPVLTGEPREVARAERLILPGVGAFASARAALDRCGLAEPVLRFIDTGRPFLGICVGMQLLMESSTEFGLSQGFGLIAGHVDRIPSTTGDGARHPVPHVCWAPLAPPEGWDTAWTGTPLAPLTPGRSACYFLHSFMAVPADPKTLIARTDYDGQPITAAVRRDNVFGVQFHPERSGPAGQKVLRAFAGL